MPLDWHYETTQASLETWKASQEYSRIFPADLKDGGATTQEKAMPPHARTRVMTGAVIMMIVRPLWGVVTLVLPTTVMLLMKKVPMMDLSMWGDGVQVSHLRVGPTREAHIPPLGAMAAEEIGLDLPSLTAHYLKYKKMTSRLAPRTRIILMMFRLGQRLRVK